MRPECADCIIYRSFPDCKGDCDPCLLDLDWDKVKRELEEYNKQMEELELRR